MTHICFNHLRRDIQSWTCEPPTISYTCGCVRTRAGLWRYCSTTWRQTVTLYQGPSLTPSQRFVMWDTVGVWWGGGGGSTTDDWWLIYSTCTCIRKSVIGSNWSEYNLTHFGSYVKFFTRFRLLNIRCFGSTSRKDPSMNREQGYHLPPAPVSRTSKRVAETLWRLSNAHVMC